MVVEVGRVVFLGKGLGDECYCDFNCKLNSKVKCKR